MASFVAINKEKVLSLLFTLLFLLPLGVFFFKAGGLGLPGDGLGMRVLFSTLLQATFSGMGSVFLGLLGSLGLLALKENHFKKLLEGFLLLPLFLPALVTVLAWISVCQWIVPVAFSFQTVLVVHIMMHTGLVAVFFCRLFQQNKAQNLCAYAGLSGNNRWSLLKALVFYEYKKDLILIFLLVFAFCFTSFSVPLLVGGASGGTLEVLIAEKLKIPALWPEALGILSVEIIFLFLFFYVFYCLPQKTHFNFLNFKEYGSSLSTKKQAHPLPSYGFLGVALFPSVLLVLGLFAGMLSPTAWTELKSITFALPQAVGYTVLVGLGVGALSFALLCLVAFCVQHGFLRKFLLSYHASSTALVGFVFLLAGFDHQVGVFFKWILGLSFLLLPPLYRLMGETVLSPLMGEVRAANLMGASQGLIFTHVLWPRIFSPFLFLSGTAAFWACGDFAYSSIVSYSGPGHLALLIQDVFATYRWETAGLLLWLLIFTGGGCFIFFLSLTQTKHLFLREIKHV